MGTKMRCVSVIFIVLLLTSCTSAEVKNISSGSETASAVSSSSDTNSGTPTVYENIIVSGSQNDEENSPEYIAMLKRQVDILIEADNQKNKTDRVLLTVNGDPIYYAQFAYLKAGQQMTKEAAQYYADNFKGTDEQKEEMLNQITIKTDDEIMDELITTRLEIQECDRRRISVSDKDALAAAKDSYNAIKEVSETDSTGRFLTAFAEAKGMTLKEYFESPDYVTTQKWVLRKAELFSQITKDVESEPTQKRQEYYKDYIESLRKKAKIVEVDPIV